MPFGYQRLKETDLVLVVVQKRARSANEGGNIILRSPSIRLFSRRRRVNRPLAEREAWFGKVERKQSFYRVYKQFTRNLRFINDLRGHCALNGHVEQVRL